MENEIKIFDTHAHYCDNSFSQDIKQVLKNAYCNGVTDVVLIGASEEESNKVPKLCQQINSSFGNKNELYPKAFYTIGIHPDEIPSFEPNSDEGEKFIGKLERLVLEASFVGIGEVGLDYYGENKTNEKKELQKKWFIRFIELANDLKTTLVVHSRDAAEDTYNILEKHRGQKSNTVVHCYSYDKEMAKRFLKLDYSFGIGGVLTFKNAKKLLEAVQIIPLENCVLETDCPYLSPEPNRGKRNESANLIYVLDKLFEIKKDKIYDKKELSEILYNNSLQLYNITNQ